MPSDLPTISIIIPTLNAGETLGLCLESVRAQDYPLDRIEIIIGDGGSTDDTLEVARHHGVDRVVRNPLRTGEAGKSVAAETARNEVLAFIDSDNILDRPDWIRRMVAPFADPDIVACEPLEYTYRVGDTLITRYCALMGMNDPLCYFIGNYDRVNRISCRWTEMSIQVEDRGGYLKVTLNERHLPTIGANGFLVRREAFLDTIYKPYLFDIDVLYDLVRAGHSRVAKVKIGIVHLFAGDSRSFARKQGRRVKDFLHYRKLKIRRYPWGGVSRFCLLKFVASTVLVVPLLIQAARGMARTFDRAWLFHVNACWLTLAIYGWVFMKDLVFRQTGVADRAGWRQ